jgi:hypothetical protein
MKMLVAFERSGVVREAFRARGHDAWSCDLVEAEDGSFFHYIMNAYEVSWWPQHWDLVIAHPPCQYLANSGVRWLKDNPRRKYLMEEAAGWFWNLLQLPTKYCIENPVPHKYAVEIMGRKYDQTIQPYQFGHPESKRTCLWLKGLPRLRATKILERPPCGYWDNQTPSGQNKLGPSDERSQMRARTYTGIAKAMAEQWG